MQLPEPFNPAELAANPELAAIPAVLPLPDGGHVALWMGQPEGAPDGDLVLVLDVLRANAIAERITLDVDALLSLGALLGVAAVQMGLDFSDAPEPGSIQ